MAEQKKKETGEIAKLAKAGPDYPDTPSGQGLAAAEGLEGEAASEAYWKAYNKARWGTA
jgi:hypothetical protein